MTLLHDETWMEIFSYFEDYMPLKGWWMFGEQLEHEGRKTLHALSLVCHHFQRIAQPILYRSLLLEAIDDIGERQECLMRTLYEHPELGQYARNIALDDGFTRYRDQSMRYQYKKHPQKDVVELALESLRVRRSAGQRIKSFHLNLHGSPVAYTPRVRFVDFTLFNDENLLVAMLSGCLDVDEGLMEEAEGQETTNEGEEAESNAKHMPLLNRRISTDYSFPHLTEVRVRGGGMESIASVLTIEPILLHPTLKILRTLGILWNGEESEKLKWPDRVSNLQYLDLKESITDAAGLRSVLTRCPSLNGVSIEMAGWKREHGRDENSWKVNLDDFHHILKELGRGLEKFDIHTMEYNDSPIHSTDLKGRLGSLQGLSALKHLKCAKMDLLGDPRKPVNEVNPLALRFSEALPLSLETLHLYYEVKYRSLARPPSKQSINEELHSFIVEDKLPNLREIQIERVYNEKREGEWDFDLKMDGWEVTFRDEHVGERYTSTGCMRTFLILSKKQLNSLD
ncbi:hypothetical protein NW762_011384 [Fusarium torreyae]|uniref:F-box domain-containing protein n=1 Tax=Fusarium torreyae TaxID=1237075 RepID=A0A9W8RT02_9HYPO|nr:hypothetical protein NW762_011384 [Fusarium torreyae]